MLLTKFPSRKTSLWDLCQPITLEHFIITRFAFNVNNNTTPGKIVLACLGNVLICMCLDAECRECFHHVAGLVVQYVMVPSRSSDNVVLKFSFQIQPAAIFGHCWLCFYITVWVHLTLFLIYESFAGVLARHFYPINGFAQIWQQGPYVFGNEFIKYFMSHKIFNGKWEVSIIVLLSR